MPYEELSDYDNLRNESDEIDEKLDEKRQHIQEELDSIDLDCIRVQILTHIRKKEVVSRLNELEAANPKEAKAFYREYKEMLYEFTAEQVDEMEEYHEAVVAFFVSETYLEDLYKYAKLHEKWS